MTYECCFILTEQDFRSPVMTIRTADSIEPCEASVGKDTRRHQHTFISIQSDVYALVKWHTQGLSHWG